MPKKEAEDIGTDGAKAEGPSPLRGSRPDHPDGDARRDARRCGGGVWRIDRCDPEVHGAVPQRRNGGSTATRARRRSCNEAEEV